MLQGKNVRIVIGDITLLCGDKILLKEISICENICQFTLECVSNPELDGIFFDVVRKDKKCFLMSENENEPTPLFLTSVQYIKSEYNGQLWLGISGFYKIEQFFPAAEEKIIAKPKSNISDIFVKMEISEIFLDLED